MGSFTFDFTTDSAWNTETCAIEAWFSSWNVVALVVDNVVPETSDFRRWESSSWETVRIDDTSGWIVDVFADPA